MTSQIVRRGNKLMIEIPEELADQGSLAEGDVAEWVLNANRGFTLVIVRKASINKNSARVSLDELLEGIPEGTRLGECDWGPDRGAEILPPYDLLEE